MMLQFFRGNESKKPYQKARGLSMKIKIFSVTKLPLVPYSSAPNCIKKDNPFEMPCSLPTCENNQ